MLVRFRSDAGDILIFGDVAVALLKMMGQSGGIPGALLAADVPAALSRLQRAAAAGQGQAPTPPPKEGEHGGEPKISLRQRAFPLIELLARAAKRECDVIWEEERPLTR